MVSIHIDVFALTLDSCTTSLVILMLAIEQVVRFYLNWVSHRLRLLLVHLVWH